MDGCEGRVAVTGLGAGVSITIRGAGVGVTIIDCQSSNQRAFLFDTKADGFFLEDFSIVNGGGPNTAYNKGGCMRLMDASTVTFTRIHVNGCMVDDGAVTKAGCVEVGQSSSLTIVDSTLENCEATGPGGCVQVPSGSSLILDGAILRSCTAGTVGGAIAVQNSNLFQVIGAGASISSSTAELEGGGVYLDQTAAIDVVAGAVFDVYNNEAGTSGGGIAVMQVGGDAPSGSIRGATIRDNSAAVCGGGMWWGEGVDVVLTDSLVAGNVADFGGAVCFAGAGSTGSLISNTVLSGNSATDGGGLYVTGSTSATLHNLTITDNTADFGAGAYFGTGAVPTLSGSLITQNHALVRGALYTTNDVGSTIDTVGTVSCTNYGGDAENADTSCSGVSRFVNPPPGDCASNTFCKRSTDPCTLAGPPATCTSACPTALWIP
ncbi:uncharacterized protein AMSG_11661 [Thecamonas trahens ATCC 50062]|uniref:Right handed beta helix domain-containing protein n=1 Tax=Thecamonas trahens ATCC 50062 TaxID=461836 RepID=A0A0L0DRE5_THETB|nr:hypothetical protein AMSG_11661 [Thecamonas trahens ATCC 50062]KNC54832.1 hypothetical protein AMSG_11661 [Thecamonas trahens ATCC 50062]|eukprot:XP_013761771.1 hypothetical protein AMSG_11661 [Thecamonas trahens ATCC 50062]